jgi:hypothetical protein
VQRSGFLTPTAVSSAREAELESPSLPALERPPSLAQAVLGITTVVWAVLDPTASPVLFGFWMAAQVGVGITSMVHERRLLCGVERTHARALALFGPHHEATVTLGRYHRLLTRLLRQSPGGVGMRALARRWALCQRLAHRCQHLMDQWPRLAAPTQPPPLPPLLPAPDHQAVQRAPMAARARGRRLARRR